MTDQTDRYIESQNLLAESNEDRVTDAILNEGHEAVSIQVGVQALFKEAFDRFLKGASMFNKLTFLLNMTSRAQTEGSEIDWELIYGYLKKYPKMEDFNIITKPQSIQDLYQIYENLHYGSLGLGPWQEHTCKTCKEKFFLNYGEVQFYLNRKLFLPKRCPSCRSK